ncbi:MAG: phosphoribosylformylglycinamidine cyclo-ligase [Alphaproteobacteria bacterium]
MSDKISYKDAGVSIEAGDIWAAAIGKMVKANGKNTNIIGGIGGFAGLYQINNKQLLAACADGVGTKMELAKQAQNLKGLGQDLVAMNVNDLICCGAQPLFFLDYLACGVLKANEYSILIEDILNACNQSSCALLGGETAEMPDVYDEDGFDLAGFSVGLVDKDKLIDGSQIQKGDVIIGLPSSGVHSNGFSLVRKVVEKVGFANSPIEALLQPTKLYVAATQKALKEVNIYGMAHITGGGFKANVERVLNGHKAKINWNSWQRPDIFVWLSEHVAEDEMQKVFNLGVGFVFILRPQDAQKLLELLKDDGAFICGEVV